MRGQIDRIEQPSPAPITTRKGSTMSNTTTTTWTMAGTWQGEQITLDAHAERYQDNGRLAILLYAKGGDDDGELFADLTINAPHILLMEEDRQVIVNPDLPSEVLTIAFDAGLLHEAPEMRCKVGMAAAVVAGLTEGGLDWATERAPAL